VKTGRKLTDRASRPFVLEGGEELAVRVRESPRARTMRLVVGPRRPLEVRVPKKTKDPEIDAFMASKRRWINEKVAYARATASRPPQLGLELPWTAWIGGRPLPIERGKGRRAIARLAGDTVIVDGPPDRAPAALERWYRHAARARLAEATDREAERLGLVYRSIAIRDLRTRWGSCSSRGNLSYSWRLILAPSEVLEYVVVHELLHLRQLNHSKAFWRLVEAARPNWKEQAGWLREHGQELHDFACAAAFSDEHRAQVELGSHRSHRRLLGARGESLRRVEDAWEELDVADAVQEDAGLAEDPADGEVDLRLFDERFVPGGGVAVS
jgi:predicted metal-dependent hydrolase